MLSLQAISTMVHFYMGTKGPENVSTVLSHIWGFRDPWFQVGEKSLDIRTLKSVLALILDNVKGLSLVGIFNEYSKRRNNQIIISLARPWNKSK